MGALELPAATTLAGVITFLMPSLLRMTETCVDAFNPGRFPYDSVRPDDPPGNVTNCYYGCLAMEP